MDFSTPIRLFPAELNDLDEICTLCHTVALRTPASLWDDNYPNRPLLERDLQNHSLYKVLDGTHICSIMQIRPWADFLAGEDVPFDLWRLPMHNPCALGRFCVDPDLQGQGLGRRVMAASLEKAAGMGYDGARFYAIKTNAAAIHLYDTMGFRRAGELQEYGIDFLCYEIRLPVCAEYM